MADITTAVYYGGDHATPNQFPAGPPVAAAAGLEAWRDVEYGGSGTLTGLTQVQTGPATIVPLGHCRVFICDQRSGYLVRATISDAAGAYTIPSIDPTKTYLAVALDPTGAYDAAVTRSLQVSI